MRPGTGGTALNVILAINPLKALCIKGLRLIRAHYTTRRLLYAKTLRRIGRRLFNAYNFEAIEERSNGRNNQRKQRNAGKGAHRCPECLSKFAVAEQVISGFELGSGQARKGQPKRDAKCDKICGHCSYSFSIRWRASSTHWETVNSESRYTP